jgi:hypothetical protein
LNAALRGLSGYLAADGDEVPGHEKQDRYCRGERTDGAPAGGFVVLWDRRI